MIRVYHPFWEWEDIGMWRNVSGADRERLLREAEVFTGNSERYGAAMLRIIDEFPIATLHNLTDENQNRRAWIGHAACYLALECPEDIVREAWGRLTERQRKDANAAADRAISEWQRRHEKENRGLHYQMDFAGIPGWDTR
jgi:hypothetical protein